VSVQTPIYSEDYSRHWPVNVEGKTVIDFGADYGSTAYYFLSKGAIRVICVEGNPTLYKQLEANIRFLHNCVAVYKNIQAPADFADILTSTAETVKVDVEGAERHLVTSSLSLKAGASTTPLVSRPAIGSQVRSRFRKLAGFEAPHTDNLSHSHDGTTPSRREDGASPKVGDTFKSVHPNSMLHCWSGDRHKQLSHNPHISVIGFHPHPKGMGISRRTS